MKILLIHPHDIYSLQEPWTTRIVNIGKELFKKGHQVKIIYFPLNWSRAKRAVCLNKIQTIPLSRKIGPLNFLRNIYKVYKIAKWADIIHFQKCFHWASIPAIFAGYLTNKPLHYDWDDWEEKIFIASNKKPSWPVVRFLQILERLLPELVDSVSVSSDRLRELSLSYGLAKERIFKVPVGVDLELFNPRLSGNQIKTEYSLKGPIVLYLGQLHGGQYADLFLEAAQIISRQYSRVGFLIVGDGYKLAELKGLARLLGLKNIVFTGAKPHTEVPDYIGCADICVACFEENDITRCKSPLKIMEYLALGKAIVASDVGEVRNMVGEAALFVPPNSAHTVARGIVELLKDKKTREELGKKARLHAEKNCSWVLRAETLIKAYKLASNRTECFCRLLR